MDKRNLSTAALIAMSVIIAIALTWGVTLNWPDYVHVNYGFPLTWGVHTLSTIQGAADNWSVNISALVLDLLIWLGLTVLSQVIIQKRTNQTA
jgi:hypothetical protein